MILINSILYQIPYVRAVDFYISNRWFAKEDAVESIIPKLTKRETLLLLISNYDISYIYIYSLQSFLLREKFDFDAPLPN